MRKFIVAATLVFILGVAFAGARAEVGSKAPGTVFKDCPDCPQMVVVPAGSITMGASAEEQTRESVPPEMAAAESPSHAITIRRPFAVARVEVTKDDYARFVAATGRVEEKGCDTLHVDIGKWGADPDKSWRDPGFPQSGRDPVVCVSWNDAQAYLAWLSSRAGKKYRLLSEAEYEYAARAHTTTARFWGDDRGEACRYANVSDQTKFEAHKSFQPEVQFPCRDSFIYTAPVGHFRPNAFGLFDMSGNAWSWVQDCFHPDYDGAPIDGSAWVSGDCARHMDRGGSWVSSPKYLRSAVRHKDVVDERNTNLSFRVARDLS